MFENPVGAAGGCFEAASGTVAGGVDAVFVVEVYLGGVLVILLDGKGQKCR